ncbi:MAG: hypothetical protein LBQ88_20245 [Treponema sp.]|jgi:hypothetical protein|nr:hypothetical protein [Treponema sp.]
MADMRLGIGLDVSDLVANAQRAKNALESVHKAFDSSLKNDNLDDVKEYGRASLEARKNFIKDAQIGGYSDKVLLDDSGQLQDYIKGIESKVKQMISEGRAKEAREYQSILNDFLNQATAEQVDRGNHTFEDTVRQSINSGDMDAVHSQLDQRKKFLEDARAGGDSDIKLDSGPLENVIKELTAAMNTAIGEGKTDEAAKYGSLIKDFQKQVSFEKTGSEAPNFEDTIARLIHAGDTNQLRTYSQSQLDSRKQFVEEARIGGDSDIKLDSGPLERIMKELKDAINQAVSEGKTDKAKEYQSILGGFKKQVDLEQGDDEREKRLKQAQQIRLVRNLARFTSAQNVIGSAGAGNVAGAALGAAGGIGDLISQLPKGALIGGAVVGGLAALAAGANKLSEQWEKVMQPSMGLAASLGRLGDDAEKNHAAFQEVFSRATDRRVLHGYKMEEGIALANQLSKTGIAADNVIGGEEQVFRYQRMTDADRGDLTRAVGYAGRYRNNENVLGYAFGGVKESGMQQGQYQEYLNATLRIFEEGLAKGVVKGFAEITRAQNMLAHLGDTWKGEQGAERIVRMEDAITGASNLQSDYDVIMFQAAAKMAQENGGKPGYLDISEITDQGITAGDGKILEYIHEIVKGISGGDTETEGIIYKKMFNLNTEAAKAIRDALNGVDGKGLKDAQAVFEDPDSSGVDGTPEMRLLTATEGIRTDLANLGENVIGAKTGIVDAISKLTHIMAGDKTFAASTAKTMSVLSDVGLTGDRQLEIDKAFEKAYTTAEDQPDEDDNGKGDYAEQAETVQAALRGRLPKGYKYWAAMNPDNFLNQKLDQYKGADDFTAENTRMALGAIDVVLGQVQGKSEEDFKREYVQWAAGQIPDDKHTKDDDTLRDIFTNRPDEVPAANLKLLMDQFTDKGSDGNEKLTTAEIRHMLRSLYDISPGLKDAVSAMSKASAAMEENSTLNIEVR